MASADDNDPAAVAALLKRFSFGTRGDTAAPAVCAQWQRTSMSRNIETVNRYLDGFRKNDHQQILSCLTDDIEWTVFGAFHLTGKDAYDKAIDGAPEFIDPPELEVVRMVEQGDVVMAELTGRVQRSAGGELRLSMAEVFVMREGRIAERRAWVIPLQESDCR
jgi:ketosteroid isomerase-like protein